LAIEQLVSLATKSEEAIKLGSLDQLGRIMSDVWLLHQELDPFCSNEVVDAIFREVHEWASGYKLVGAGGGGFGMLMAKDEHAAKHAKEVLRRLSIRVYNWSLFDVV
jgi:fucokinase